MSTRTEAPSAEQVLKARKVAVSAQLDAEEKAATARRAKRRATARMRHYEDLLARANGAIPLPFEFKDGESTSRS